MTPINLQGTQTISVMTAWRVPCRQRWRDGRLDCRAPVGTAAIDRVRLIVLIDRNEARYEGLLLPNDVPRTHLLVATAESINHTDQWRVSVPGRKPVNIIDSSCG